MNDIHDTVKQLWHNYLLSINENEQTTNKKYVSWCFGGSGESSDKLAELVYKKQKTATSSLYSLYAIDNTPLPKEGDLSIITTFNGFAVCLIETIKVQVLPFSHVNEEFAFKEGEGDRTLTYWRNIHTNFFSQELKSIDKVFSPGMLIVCEEFKVLARAAIEL